MYLSFELSMPNNNSWNGEWSGAGQKYVVVRSFRTEPMTPDGKRLAGSYHYYNFGDGWGAGVTVRECTVSAARDLRKKSAGFCGYDWMIDEIIAYGRILKLQERTKAHIEATDKNPNSEQMNTEES